MRRRPAIILVVALAVVAAGVVVIVRRDGGGKTAPAAPARTARPHATSAAATCDAWDAVAPSLPESAGTGDALATSQEAVTGTLANGLTYVVRHNDHPGGGSAQLSLVVNAGSALEDPDQSGAAHFLEHMLFNGTEQFPGNQLTTVLQGLGVQFGADLNATTSYDETVYGLEIDAGDAAKLGTALDVLYQWSSKATIDQQAVVDERGVILAEERARRESASGRAQTNEVDLVLAGSAYAGREPIGTVDAIKAMDATKLRRFYRDWYRPDLMQVVAVGDFDTSAVEQAIKDRFEALPAAAADARPRPKPTPPAPDAPRIKTYADAESTSAYAAILLARPQGPDVTSGDVRARELALVATDVLANRLADDARRGSAPYYRAQVQGGELVRDVDVRLLSLEAEPEDLRGAVGAALQELARARRHGFTDAELARAVSDRQRQSDVAQRTAETPQDADLADQYATAFVTATALVTPEARHDAETAALASFTAAEVTTALGAMTACADLGLLVQSPDSFAGSLPSDDDVATAIAAAGADDPGTREPEPDAPAALMDAPDAAKVVSTRRAQIQDPATELTFANGVRVVIQPTPIERDHVVFGAASPGGLSVVADADVPDAQLAAELVDGSGVGHLDAVQVERALTGHVVELHSTITDTTAGFSGGSAAADLEPLLQLVHQRMTAPRIDPGALAEVVGTHRIVAADPSRDPTTAKLRALDELRFGDDPRYRHVPHPDDLAGLDVAAALRVYEDRFGDASGFVFVIAGAVDVAGATKLARQYLGTLPGTGRQEAWQDVRPDPPTLPAARTVASGHDPATTIDLVYDTPGTTDPAARAHLQVLELLLRQRLLAQVREALSATYSPDVSITDRDAPDAGIETTIDIQVDPARADEVVAAIDAVVAALRQAPVGDDELQGAVAQLVHDADFYSNDQVVEQWLHYELRPSADIRDEGRQHDALAATTAADVTALATAIWPPERRIELRVTPTP